MAGLYAGFDIAQVNCLVPEFESLTPEALQERLTDIRSRYTIEEITAFLMAGTPPPEISTIVEKIPTVHPRRARA